MINLFYRNLKLLPKTYLIYGKFHTHIIAIMTFSCYFNTFLLIELRRPGTHFWSYNEFLRKNSGDNAEFNILIFKLLFFISQTLLGYLPEIP